MLSALVILAQQLTGDLRRLDHWRGRRLDPVPLIAATSLQKWDKYG